MNDRASLDPTICFSLEDEARSVYLVVLGHASDRNQLLDVMVFEIVHSLVDGDCPFLVLL